jgi:hypothetical protein
MSNPQTQNKKVIGVIGELLGIGPEHTLTLRLAERRITPDVIMTFDIQPAGEGWTYPTPRGALRFKSAIEKKYAWIGEKRDTLLYGFDLREAIQQAGGDVWLTTEFDYFAMRSAGVYHTIAQLQGEGSVPDELPALLQSLGVLTCHVAPDRDDQGGRWAQLVADKLTPAGIDVYSRELPFPHEAKGGGDIGKLWQRYSSPRPFERYLFDLPVIQLKPKTEVKKKVQKEYIIPEDRKQQIARALGVTTYNGKGYSKPLLCPFHEDTKPSAALHREFGLHCFRCGWVRWKDLAEVIGLEWVTTFTPAPVYHQIALGDELIQAMVRAGYSVLAHTLETLYRAGRIPGDVITIKSLIALGVSTWHARKALEQMEGRGADQRKQNSRAKHGKRQGSFCQELTPFFLLQQEALILNKNSKRGRPEGRPTKAKVLPKPEDLARVFGVSVSRYTQIAQRQNLADWRAEVYALQIDRDPGTYPRKELCKPLGISTTTAQAYDKRAGVIVTPKHARVQIKSADELPDTPELKATWLETDDGRHFAATKAGHARAMRHGGRVWKVKQLANDYRLRGESDQADP